VLLGRNDTPILADFGLAKLLQSSSIKSATGVTTGTPAYMAPEQVEGSQVGPAADRYSLAVMAFEMLTGSLPFDDVGVLEVLYAHVHREPPRPSARNTSLSSRVDTIVLRGLAKDPQSRWESCDVFVAALQDAMLPVTPEPERTVAYAAPIIPPVAAAPAVAPPPTLARAVAGPTPPQRKRSRPRVWIGLGAAALILVLLVVSVGLFIASRAPTIDLRPSTVAAGGRVTVIATRVPKDQVGEIQLHSVLRVYQFRADANGDVSKDIDIPSDITPGSHEVDICWNSICRAHQTLHVTSAAAAVINPESSSGSSPSPRPSQTSGGASPSPAHAPSPTPTKTASPSLTLVSVSVKNPLNNHVPKTTFTLADGPGSTGVWACQLLAGCISLGTFGNGTYTQVTPSRIQAGLATWVAVCSSGSGCVKSNTVSPALA
jgi:hypothetical protein